MKIKSAVRGKEEKMKKKIAVVLVTLGMISTVCFGCGASENKGEQPPAAAADDLSAEDSTDGVTEEPSETDGEVRTVSGKLDVKKDMMFILDVEDGEAYSIGFETAPEGYEDLEEGDDVVMEYTGELSVVDAFTGEIISLKPAE